MRTFDFNKFTLKAPDLWSDVSFFFQEDESGNKPIAISPDDETFMDFLLYTEPDKERHDIENLFRELIIIGRKKSFKMRCPQDTIKYKGKYNICGGSYYRDDECHRFWFLSDGFNIIKISLHTETRWESHYNKISDKIIQSIEIKTA